jgi:hypothetical protein
MQRVWHRQYNRSLWAAASCRAAARRRETYHTAAHRVMLCLIRSVPLDNAMRNHHHTNVERAPIAFNDAETGKPRVEPPDNQEPEHPQRCHARRLGVVTRARVRCVTVASGQSRAGSCTWRRSGRKVADTPCLTTSFQNVGCVRMLDDSWSSHITEGGSSRERMVSHMMSHGCILDYVPQCCDLPPPGGKGNQASPVTARLSRGSVLAYVSQESRRSRVLEDLTASGAARCSTASRPRLRPAA